MPNPEQTAEAPANPASTKKLRICVHTCAGVALVLMFAMAVTGWMSHVIMSNPYTVSPDPLWNRFNEWRGLVLPFHRWGGSLLLISVLGAGVAGVRIIRHAKGLSRLAILITAWGTLVLGSVSIIYSHATGMIAGPTSHQITPEESAGGSTDHNLVTRAFRDKPALDAYNRHLDEGLWLLGAASLALVALSMAASAVGRREESSDES